MIPHLLRIILPFFVIGLGRSATNASSSTVDLFHSIMQTGYHPLQNVVNIYVLMQIFPFLAAYSFIYLHIMILDMAGRKKFQAEAQGISPQRHPHAGLFNLFCFFVIREMRQGENEDASPRYWRFASFVGIVKKWCFNISIKNFPFV